MKLFAVRAVLIVMIAISLFFVADFFVAVPSLERIVMDQKRELIRELTNSAWNILAKFENDERTGILTRDQAQREAIRQIQTLHYGIELKDYFWINDMHPRMVIHPYRTDLNGKDLTDFVDPRGKRLFMEVVRVVRENGAGYVSYMWQWMDDPNRVVPKISYVKGFEPWGWIIGTGVYIDDIQKEISQARRNVIAVSFGILLLSTSLLIVLLYESLKTERKRRLAEQALKISEERYRLLVESAGECIFMGIRDAPLLANHNLLSLLGYTPEEFSQLEISDFLVQTEEEKGCGEFWVNKVLQGEGVPSRYETALRSRDGRLHDITLALSHIVIQDRHGFIAVASEITPKRAREIQQEKILMELQSLVFFLDRPVGEICSRSFPELPETDTLEAAAAAMKRDDAPVVAVQDANGRISGLVSRETVLRHLAGCKQPGIMSIGSLVREIPGKVSEKALAYEAYVRMQEHDFDPIEVIDQVGHLTGVITERDVLMLQNYSPTLLQLEIENATSASELIRINQRLPELIRILIRAGLKASHVNQIITQNTQAMVHKALEFAFDRYGPAPCEFDFMVLGSEGRFEQTLKTDQDNAIIYRDPPLEQAESARQYFLTLGTEVCTILNDVGYIWCEGGIMARNQEWNQPLSAWKKTFSGWLTALEADDLLMAKIFFDFRTGSGRGDLVTQLQSALDGTIDEHPRFFYLLARNVLLYEPPLTRFGGFVITDGPDGRKGIDIKSAMTLIVDFARIYSLKHHIWLTNTPDRLNALAAADVLPESSVKEMVQAFDYLMQIRIENQVRALERQGRPGNIIDPDSLTSIEQKILKEIFSEIRHFQAKLSYDFTGTMLHG
ncbi:cache domain-containing protein [bacterium]|nr:cache domain-containing protein [candidate division CSSED10-310 bacterium]